MVESVIGATRPSKNNYRPLASSINFCKVEGFIIAIANSARLSESRGCNAILNVPINDGMMVGSNACSFISAPASLEL